MRRTALALAVSLTLVSALVLAAVAFASDTTLRLSTEEKFKSADATAEELNTISTITAEPRTDANASVLKLCRLDRPSQVQRYYVECSDATTLVVEVQDVAVPGDHWQAKAKIWDGLPNTAVTTAPGGQNVFGAPAEVYTYAQTQPLRALVECSYLHGTNNFSADGVLRLSTDGTCTPTVTSLGLIDAIDRTP